MSPLDSDPAQECVGRFALPGQFDVHDSADPAFCVE
jgi:hypothetical protein